MSHTPFSTGTWFAAPYLTVKQGNSVGEHIPKREGAPDAMCFRGEEKWLI
jgi:hypothetical protein